MGKQRRHKHLLNILCFLFVFSQLVTTLHFILVHHEYCFQHNEITHSSHSANHGSSKEDSEEKEEHCSLISVISHGIAPTIQFKLKVIFDDIYTTFDRPFYAFYPLYRLSPSLSPPLSFFKS